MLTRAIKTIRELGRPLDVLLFALGGGVGLFLPFLFHVIAGFFFLPVSKEQWDTFEEGQTVRHIFIVSGCLAVVLPALVSGVLLWLRSQSQFKRAVLMGGLAAGALAMMIYLSTDGYSFILR